MVVLPRKWIQDKGICHEHCRWENIKDSYKSFHQLSTETMNRNHEHNWDDNHCNNIFLWRHRDDPVQSYLTWGSGFGGKDPWEKNCTFFSISIRIHLLCHEFIHSFIHWPSKMAMKLCNAILGESWSSQLGPQVWNGSWVVPLPALLLFLDECMETMDFFICGLVCVLCSNNSFPCFWMDCMVVDKCGSSFC